jgi:hypothetical protein
MLFAGVLSTINGRVKALVLFSGLYPNTGFDEINKE